MKTDTIINIISTSTTFFAFFFSQYQMFKQRKMIIRNQITTELRNEMLVIFDRIGHHLTKSSEDGIFSKAISTEYHADFTQENKELFMDICNRVLKHNNHSLINEFKFHRVAAEFKKQFPQEEMTINLYKI